MDDFRVLNIRDYVPIHSNTAPINRRVDHFGILMRGCTILNVEIVCMAMECHHDCGVHRD